MGAKPNWKTPFFQVQQQIRQFHAAGLRFHHVSVVSDTHDQHRVNELAATLEPALDGWPLSHHIVVPTQGVKVHAHLFFGADWSRLQDFSEALGHVTDLIAAIPSGLLPRFAFPHLTSQLDTNLLRWMCLVHAVAWRREAIYLQAAIEFEASPDDGIFPWPDCPQPPESNPLPWLIHQADDGGGPSRLKQRFLECGARFPHLVDAYLAEDALYSSMVAIDVLAHILPAEKASGLLSKRAPKSNSTRMSPRRDLRRALAFLASELRSYHSGESEWRPPPGKHPPHPTQPLTQDQIASLMDCSQTTAHRYMLILFCNGKVDCDPMDVYARTFVVSPKAGYRRLRNEDGIMDVDGIVDDAFHDDLEL